VMLTCLLSASVWFEISLELLVKHGVNESKGRRRVWLFCASGPETNYAALNANNASDELHPTHTAC
jgi:hypothetical protein